MVARAEGYYGSVFQVSRGATQGDPLPPTISSVVVDAVVRHWAAVMVESADERSRRVQEGRHQNALFYADSGMVASLEPQWLQGAFSTIVGMFNRVFLKINIRKTAGKVCCPCQAAGTQLEAEYRIRTTRARPSYPERQRVWVQ